MAATLEQTVKTRSGTVDLGKDFEYLTVARLALELVTAPDVEDFSISSNDDAFGSFDDVVLQVKFQNQQLCKWAVQLKHAQKEKYLPVLSMAGEKGDFAISKYLNSYKSCKSLAQCQLVVFTNQKFDGGKEIRISLEDVLVAFTEVQGGLPFIDTGGHSYQMKFVGNEQPSDEFQKFARNFYLCTNQANVHKLKDSIPERFRKEFDCSDDVQCSEWLEGISQWMKKTGKKLTLSRNSMRCIIGLQVMSPFIKPWTLSSTSDNMALLKDAMAEFDYTVFKVSSYDCLNENWGMDESVWGKDKENNAQVIAKYQLKLNISQNLQDFTEEDWKELSKLLWITNSFPLIVEVNESTLKAIRLCETTEITRRFILLQENLEVNLAGKTIFRKFVDLRKMRYFEIMLQQFTYSIKGKPAVRLEELFGKKKGYEFIDADDLLQIVGRMAK